MAAESREQTKVEPSETPTKEESILAVVLSLLARRELASNGGPVFGPTFAGQQFPKEVGCVLDFLGLELEAKIFPPN